MSCRPSRRCNYEVMAVRRAKKPREGYQLGGLRLYREDLEAIADIVREECGSLLIEFHDEGQHTGNDPGDFAAVAGVLPEDLDRLTLTGNGTAPRSKSISDGGPRSW